MISWFLSIDGHNFLTEIDREYIINPYNHLGIKNLVPNFKEVLNMLLNPNTPEEHDLENKEFFN